MKSCVPLRQHSVMSRAVVDAIAAPGARVTLILCVDLCSIVRDPSARLRAAAAEDAAWIVHAAHACFSVRPLVAVGAVKALAGAALHQRAGTEALTHLRATGIHNVAAGADFGVVLAELASAVAAALEVRAVLGPAGVATIQFNAARSCTTTTRGAAQRAHNVSAELAICIKVILVARHAHVFGTTLALVKQAALRRRGHKQLSYTWRFTQKSRVVTHLAGVSRAFPASANGVGPLADQLKRKRNQALGPAVPTRRADPGRPGSTRPTRAPAAAGQPGPARPARALRRGALTWRRLAGGVQGAGRAMEVMEWNPEELGGSDGDEEPPAGGDEEAARGGSDEEVRAFACADWARAARNPVC